jgi:hypothetical protein
MAVFRRKKGPKRPYSGGSKYLDGSQWMTGLDNYIFDEKRP